MSNNNNNNNNNMNRYGGLKKTKKMQSKKSKFTKVKRGGEAFDTTNQYRYAPQYDQNGEPQNKNINLVESDNVGLEGDFSKYKQQMNYYKEQFDTENCNNKSYGDYLGRSRCNSFKKEYNTAQDQYFKVQKQMKDEIKNIGVTNVINSTKGMAKPVNQMTGESSAYIQGRLLKPNYMPNQLSPTNTIPAKKSWGYSFGNMFGNNKPNTSNQQNSTSVIPSNNVPQPKKSHWDTFKSFFTGKGGGKTRRNKSKSKSTKRRRHNRKN